MSIYEEWQNPPREQLDGPFPLPQRNVIIEDNFFRQLKGINITNQAIEFGTGASFQDGWLGIWADSRVGWVTLKPAKYFIYVEALQGATDQMWYKVFEVEAVDPGLTIRLVEHGYPEYDQNLRVGVISVPSISIPLWAWLLGIPIVGGFILWLMKKRR